MCPPPQACDNYVPDYERSESMCYGFGYQPPCRNCGAPGNEHPPMYLTRLSNTSKSLAG